MRVWVSREKSFFDLLPVFLADDAAALLSAGARGARLLDVVEAEAPVGGLCGGRAPLQAVRVHVDDEGFHKA